VAGLLFVFAIVVMPGIKRLTDREFIRAFQAMDGIIQDNQPLFVLVWVGSAIAVIAATLLGLGQLDGSARLLLLSTAIAYVVGVQVLTIAVNIPLNNRLQALNVDRLDATAQHTARSDFEPRWNRWNALRTIIAILVSAGLMILLVLL
jgi:uncharacterized membrane protein